MSIHISDLVRDNSKAKGNDRLVLLEIADCANHEGENAFPSIGRLARRCNCSESTVRRSMEALVELGELIVEERPGTSNLYRIPLEVFGEKAVKKHHKKTSKAVGKSTTKAPRARNPLWDAVLAACNVNPFNLNQNEKGKYGKVVKLLKESNATPEDVFRRAEQYKKKFPNASLTPTALANRWSELDASIDTATNLNGVVPQGWNAIKAAREQRLVDIEEQRKELVP